MRHLHFSNTHIPQPSEMQSSFLLRNVRSFQLLTCWPKETSHADLTECWALSSLTSTAKARDATEEDTLRKAAKAKGRKKKYNVLLLFKKTC